MLVHGVRPDSLANADEYFGAHALELDRNNVTTLVLGAGVETILTAGYMTDDPRPLVAAAEKIIVGGFSCDPGPRSEPLRLCRRPFCLSHAAMGLSFCMAK